MNSRCHKKRVRRQEMSRDIFFLTVARAPDRNKKIIVNSLISTLSIAAIAGLLAVQSAQAATNTWIGNTSNLWSIGSNWSGGLAPVNGDTLGFGTPGSSRLTLPARGDI
jgi:hypothetical protein